MTHTLAEVLDRLTTLRRHSMDDGPHSRSSSTTAALNAAQSVAEQLYRLRGPMPDVVRPNGEGGIVLCWRQLAELEVDIGPLGVQAGLLDDEHLGAGVDSTLLRPTPWALGLAVAEEVVAVAALRREQGEG